MTNMAAAGKIFRDASIISHKNQHPSLPCELGSYSAGQLSYTLPARAKIAQKQKNVTGYVTWL